MKKIAVIILNWNGEGMLREYLPSIVSHTPAGIADVIVADNGSTDSSLQYLADTFPHIRVLPFGENLGFAEGYNKAVDSLRDEYEYVVLLNSDVKVTDDWLTPLYEFMEAHPDAGAAQPKIKSLTHPDRFEYAGACGGFLDRHGYPYCRGRIFDTVEPDNGQYDTPLRIFWASGAALMVRTELYISCGGLDKAFFAHMEEIDLCWRILLAGKEIWAVPSAAVYHLGGGSLPSSSPRKTYLNFRNNLLMLRKNLPRSGRTRRLVWRRLLDTLAWAKFMACLDFGNARAVVRAHRDFSRMQAVYDTDPRVDLLSGRPNILLEYYLLRHDRFSDF